MSVHPNLARVREVGAQLDESRAELGIHDVEVVDGHRPVGFVEPEIDCLAMGALVPLVSHEDLLNLLRSNDGHYTLPALSLSLIQQREDVVDLAIIPTGTVWTLETHDGYIFGLTESLHLLPEPIPHPLEDCRGGDFVAEMGGEITHNLSADLQVGDVGVHVDAVNAFKIEHHMAVEHIVDVHHFGDGLRLPCEDSVGPTPSGDNPTYKRNHQTWAVRGWPH
jgi:hypothetical protein